MVKRVSLPSEAFDDIRTLICLSTEQLRTLDELFSNAESAFPLRASFINQVAENLKVGLDDARSVVVVCHFLLRHSDAQDDKEFVTGLLGDIREFLENSVPDEEQQSLLSQFDEKRGILESLASPKPAPLRERKIRRLESGPEPHVDDVRTVCQLRPLFEGQEREEFIAGLVPTILLEIETTISDGDSRTFAFSMGIDQLEQLEQVLKRTREKLEAIRMKYGSELLTSE